MTKPPGAIRLHVEPISVTTANDYIEIVHRHHGSLGVGFLTFAIGALSETGTIHGVALAGIPNAANRLTDGFRTMEVLRVATDGTPNACSILYAACARAAKSLGYSRILTYILEEETGASIRAAGWTQDIGEFGNQSWANRPGRTGNNFGPKGRWSLTFFETDRPAPAFPESVERLRPVVEQLELPVVA